MGVRVYMKFTEHGQSKEGTSLKRLDVVSTGFLIVKYNNYHT